METNMFYMVLIMFFLMNGILAFDSEQIMDRLDFMEDRLNAESKIRRDEFSVLFQKLESMDTNKAVGNDYKQGDIPNTRLPDQTISKLDENFKTLAAVILNAFKEEKMENTRLRQEIPEIQENIQNLKTQTELLRQTEVLTKNDFKDMAEKIEHLESNQELNQKEIISNNNIPQDLAKTISSVEDIQVNILKELEIKDAKITQTLVDKVESADLCNANSCLELFKNGIRSNGIYTIMIKPDLKVNVYCDMSTDDGGWTVFQRRQDGSTDFYRDWNGYKTGFGKPTGEFWLGNDYLNLLTENDGPHELRIELGDHEGNHAYAKYSRFTVGPESDDYRLEVSGYSGDAGDSLEYHNGMAFTTKDRDNDRSIVNCAQDRAGAWWYKDCINSNLNSIYQSLSYCRFKCVIWKHWKGWRYSMKFTEMKFR